MCHFSRLCGDCTWFAQGEIPADLGSLSNLVALDLNGNDLSGCVPSSLEDPLLGFRAFALGDLPFC